MDNNYLYEYFNRRNVNGNDMTYVVKEGDTLYNISNKYNVSLEDLMKENNLYDYLIYPNQVLIIPREKTSEGMYFEEYKVKYNDTLEKIAYNYGVTINDISKYNDLGKLKLTSEQEIKIPVNRKTHKVVATDTLDYILKATDMTAYELLELNFNNLLPVGTIIYVK